MGGPGFSVPPGVREVGNGRIRNSEFGIRNAAQPSEPQRHRGHRAAQRVPDPSQDHPEIVFERGHDLSLWLLCVLRASVVQSIPRIVPCERLRGGHAAVAPPARCHGRCHGRGPRTLKLPLRLSLSFGRGLGRGSKLLHSMQFRMSPTIEGSTFKRSNVPTTQKKPPRRAALFLGAARDQKRARSSTPTIRGSLVKPVRLLKSMPPRTLISSVMLRPKRATSYLPWAKA